MRMPQKNPTFVTYSHRCGHRCAYHGLHIFAISHAALTGTMKRLYLSFGVVLSGLLCYAGAEHGTAVQNCTSAVSIQ